MDKILFTVEPLLIYTKIIGFTPYSFTSNDVKFSKFNAAQIGACLLFWTWFFVVQFFYLVHHKMEGKEEIFFKIFTN
jgi:hypothetical protein